MKITPLTMTVAAVQASPTDNLLDKAHELRMTAYETVQDVFRVSATGVAEPSFFKDTGERLGKINRAADGVIKGMSKRGIPALQTKPIMSDVKKLTAAIQAANAAIARTGVADPRSMLDMSTSLHAMNRRTQKLLNDYNIKPDALTNLVRATTYFIGDLATEIAARNASVVKDVFYGGFEDSEIKAIKEQIDRNIKELERYKLGPEATKAIDEAEKHWAFLKTAFDRKADRVTDMLFAVSYYGNSIIKNLDYALKVRLPDGEGEGMKVASAR